MAGNPTASQQHIDAALTDFSVACLEEPGLFKAFNAFPAQGSPYQSGKFYEYTKSFFLRSEARKRARGTESAVRGYELSNTQFYCDRWSMLEALCKQHGRAEKLEEVKKAKADAIAFARTRGKDEDDAKAAAGEFFNAVKRLLEIKNPGSNWAAFFSTFVADACQPGLDVYEELKQDIFGGTRS